MHPHLFRSLSLGEGCRALHPSNEWQSYIAHLSARTPLACLTDSRHADDLIRSALLKTLKRSPRLPLAPSNALSLSALPFLGAQCLVSLSNGLAAYATPFYTTLSIQKKPPPGSAAEPIRAPVARSIFRRYRARASCGTADCMRDAELWMACTYSRRSPSCSTRTCQTRSLATCSAPLSHLLARRLSHSARTRHRFCRASSQCSMRPRRCQRPVSFEGLMFGPAGPTVAGQPQPPRPSARNLGCLRALVLRPAVARSTCADQKSRFF